MFLETFIKNSFQEKKSKFFNKEIKSTRTLRIPVFSKNTRFFPIPFREIKQKSPAQTEQSATKLYSHYNALLALTFPSGAVWLAAVCRGMYSRDSTQPPPPRQEGKVRRGASSARKRGWPHKRRRNYARARDHYVSPGRRITPQRARLVTVPGPEVQAFYDKSCGPACIDIGFPKSRR